jgi:transposase InsO family protein
MSPPTATIVWVLPQTGWTVILIPKLLTKNGPATSHNIWNADGWLYLAVVLDLSSRGVVGWAVSDRMKKNLAISSLHMAATLTQPTEGFIFHSVHRSQYCIYDYQQKLQAYSLRPSMSGKRNS